MAYCTKCKKEIDALAIKCPHCKYIFSEEKTQKEKFKYKFVRHTIVALFIFSIFSYNVFYARYYFRDLGEIILTILLFPVYMSYIFVMPTCGIVPYRFADSFHNPYGYCFFVAFGMIGSYIYSILFLSIDKRVSSYSVNGKYFPSRSLIKFFILCFFIIFVTSFIKLNKKTNYYDMAMHRISCRNNLQQIGLSLRMYSNNFNGHFPPYDGAKGLNILVKENYLNNKLVYICPTVKFNNRFKEKREKGMNVLLTDYQYCGNLNESDPKDTPLAWDKTSNHKKYRNVLFITGKVKGIHDSEWEEKISSKIIKRKLRVPDIRY